MPKTTRTAKSAPSSGAEVLNRVKPRRRVERTKVCLRADLIAEWEAAEARLVELRGQSTGNSNRLHPGVSTDTDEAAPAPVKAQARKVKKIEDEIVASQTEFVFQQLNKDEWSAVLALFPPRPDNQIDDIVGYNRDAVLDELVRACLVDPVFEDCNGCVDPECAEKACGHDRCTHEDCGTWQQLVGVISPTEWNELRSTANLANSAVVDPPKSLLASMILGRRGNS